jgi:aldehyde:ferredoxin oxidoreductase
MGVRPRIMYMPAVLYGNTLCNQLGLDVITAANSIVFLMELYEKGIITKEDTEGIPLEWGDWETFHELLRKQAYREGKLGDLLAEGPYLMAKRLANEKNMKFEDLEFYVTHSKGNDNEGWDFRPSVQIGLQHAVSTRGADHLRGMPPAHSHGPTAALQPEDLGGIPYEDAIELVKLSWDPRSYEGQEIIVHYYENVYAVQDCLEVCRFHGPFWNLPLGYELMAKAITYLTGMNFTVEKLKEIGERVYTVEKAFNIREGWTRKHDSCSPRAYKEPIPAGPIKGYVIDYEKFEKLKTAYYKHRGWDPETGLVPASRYIELGLPEIAEEMARLKKLPSKDLDKPKETKASE